MKSLLKFPAIACVSVIVVSMAFVSCKKYSGPGVIAIDKNLKSDFNFQAGSYWVYRDSLTGETDSAYVVTNEVSYFQPGCVRSANIPSQEMMIVTIQLQNVSANIANPASVNEGWYLYMIESTLSLSLHNNGDTVENLERNLDLAHYPLAPGDLPGAASCALLMAPDSGRVSGILNEYTVGGHAYAKAALSDHNASHYNTAPMQYNDRFYIVPGTGIVKVVFNHPFSGIYRVLELQRCHLVK